MFDLTIEPKEEGKGRVFRGTLVSYVTAGSLWDGGSAGSRDLVRPVWSLWAGTENELRPFIANLRIGRKAQEYGRRGAKFEILKSAGFSTEWQRTPHGATVLIYAPDLFCLDPGMVDPAGVKFVILPDDKRLPPADLALRPPGVPDDRAEALLRLAPLFIAYLDRRTRCPLIPDPRFYAQVLAAALDQGLATWSTGSRSYSSQRWGEHARHGFSEHCTSDVRLAPGVAFSASHDTLESFLAEQVKEYYR